MFESNLKLSISSNKLQWFEVITYIQIESFTAFSRGKLKICRTRITCQIDKRGT